MEPQIITFEDRKLVGMRIKTTTANDKTSTLWQSFMPRRKEIINAKPTGFYSVQAYDPTLTIENFNENTVLEKWAAVEVSAFEKIPEGMASHTLKGGLYAVFIHKGPVMTFHKTIAYIMGTWLPNSTYQHDTRDMFEILGDKYLGPTNPDSEEEVWIPIK